MQSFLQNLLHCPSFDQGRRFQDSYIYQGSVQFFVLLCAHILKRCSQYPIRSETQFHLCPQRTWEAMVRNSQIRVCEEIILMDTRLQIISRPPNNRTSPMMVHHLETVTGSFPNCPASQTPVLPASANAPLILFRFSMQIS